MTVGASAASSDGSAERSTWKVPSSSVPSRAWILNVIVLALARIVTRPAFWSAPCTSPTGSTFSPNLKNSSTTSRATPSTLTWNLSASLIRISSLAPFLSSNVI